MHTLYLVLWPGAPLKGPPEGKSLKIDSVSQNRLNGIKNHEI